MSAIAATAGMDRFHEGHALLPPREASPSASQVRRRTRRAAGLGKTVINGRPVERVCSTTWPRLARRVRARCPRNLRSSRRRAAIRRIRVRPRRPRSARRDRFEVARARPPRRPEAIRRTQFDVVRGIMWAQVKSARRRSPAWNGPADQARPLQHAAGERAGFRRHRP